LNQSIATLVDRKSRYVRLVPLPARHDAQAVRDGLIAMLTEMPPAVRLTLTWDQGAEMAHHDQIAAYLSEGVFLAQVGSPWQRGTNENTNGCSTSTSPSALTCPSAPQPTCVPSRSASTTAPARRSAGALPPTSFFRLWHYDCPSPLR
jgi:hypothetical protein